MKLQLSGAGQGLEAKLYNKKWVKQECAKGDEAAPAIHASSSSCSMLIPVHIAKLSGWQCEMLSQSHCDTQVTYWKWKKKKKIWKFPTHQNSFSMETLDCLKKNGRGRGWDLHLQIYGWFHGAWGFSCLVKTSETKVPLGRLSNGKTKSKTKQKNTLMS